MKYESELKDNEISSIFEYRDYSSCKRHNSTNTDLNSANIQDFRLGVVLRAQLISYSIKQPVSL